MSCDDVLVVLVAQRRVLLGHRLEALVLALEVLDDDQVGRAREDVVGAEQVELLLAPPSLPSSHSTAGRICWFGAAPGVDDVLGALVALVLHRVEEQAVVLLEDRQHGLAADRGPAAEDGQHLVLGSSFLALSGKTSVNFDSGSSTIGSIFLPSTPPAVVDLLDGHQLDVLAASVSLMAMVPVSECRMPTLIVCRASARAAAAPGQHEGRQRRARRQQQAGLARLREHLAPGQFPRPAVSTRVTQSSFLQCAGRTVYEERSDAPGIGSVGKQRQCHDRPPGPQNPIPSARAPKYASAQQLGYKAIRTDRLLGHSNDGCPLKQGHGCPQLEAFVAGRRGRRKFTPAPRAPAPPAPSSRRCRPGPSPSPGSPVLNSGK